MSLSNAQLTKLMAFFNQAEINHGDRVAFYKEFFPKRYVCDADSHDDEVFISESESCCFYCEEEMDYQHPKSTKHLTREEASELIDMFEEDFDGTREMIFSEIGMETLV